MNCDFRIIYLGALLPLSFFCCLGCFHGSQNIFQGLINSWLGDKLWNLIFHKGEKGLVVRPHNVTKVQLRSLFTFSERSPVVLIIRPCVSSPAQMMTIGMSRYHAAAWSQVSSAQHSHHRMPCISPASCSMSAQYCLHVRFLKPSW